MVQRRNALVMGSSSFARWGEHAAESSAARWSAQGHLDRCPDDPRRLPVCGHGEALVARRPSDPEVGNLG